MLASGSLKSTDDPRVKHLAAALALWSSPFTEKATQPFPFVRAIYTDLKIDEPSLLRLFNFDRFLDERQGFVNSSGF